MGATTRARPEGAGRGGGWAIAGGWAAARGGRAAGHSARLVSSRWIRSFTLLFRRLRLARLATSRDRFW